MDRVKNNFFVAPPPITPLKKNNKSKEFNISGLCVIILVLIPEVAL